MQVGVICFPKLLFFNPPMICWLLFLGRSKRLPHEGFSKLLADKRRLAPFMLTILGRRGARRRRKVPIDRRVGGRVFCR